MISSYFSLWGKSFLVQLIFVEYNSCEIFTKVVFLYKLGAQKIENQSIEGVIKLFLSQKVFFLVIGSFNNHDK